MRSHPSKIWRCASTRRTSMRCLKVALLELFTALLIPVLGHAQTGATSGTEIQTLTFSVGNELGRHTLENLPALNRDAPSLLLLQPMATPGFNSPGSPVATGEGDNTGGQVAGARSDQNTFLVDGGDATDSTAGGGQYSGTNFTATPRAVIPTPVESLQEFRVVTNNPEASFARSAGGEMPMGNPDGRQALH